LPIFLYAVPELVEGLPQAQSANCLSPAVALCEGKTKYKRMRKITEILSAYASGASRKKVWISSIAAIVQIAIGLMMDRARKNNA
jgi:hypothetical protein